MTQEGILLTSNRENKPRPNRLVQATDCHRGLPHLQMLFSEMCRAKVLSLLELNMKPRGNKILSVYSTRTPLYFCHLLVGRTSGSRGDLRWSSSAMKNCGCGQSQATVDPKSLGGSCSVFGLPREVRPLSPCVNTVGCRVLQFLPPQPSEQGLGKCSGSFVALMSQS